MALKPSDIEGIFQASLSYVQLNYFTAQFQEQSLLCIIFKVFNAVKQLEDLLCLLKFTRN